MPTALTLRQTGDVSRSALSSLSSIAEQWRSRARGVEYVDALRTFVASLSNPLTRKSYLRSLTEFFDWYEYKYTRTPLPSEVTREQAFAYAGSLGSKNLDLVEAKLRKADRQLDLAVFRFVRTHPGVRIDSIRAELMRHPELTTTAIRGAGPERALKIEQADPDALDVRLGCLVGQHLLARSPTVDEIRTGRVSVGLSDPHHAQIDYRLDPMIFSYGLPAVRGTEATRSSSAHTKLSVLSAFWRWLIEQSGENVSTRDALLRFNVWAPTAQRLSGQVRAHRKAMRAESVLTLNLFNRLLGTTYVAAGSSGSTDLPSDDVFDVRDRALLLTLLYVAPRVSELVKLARGDVVRHADGAHARLVGKGNKERIVSIPAPVVAALDEFTIKLERLAAAQEARRTTEVSSARAMLSTDAPLFPVLKRWGCHADRERAEPLEQSAVTEMIRNRAAKAGIEKQSPDYRRCHPHGFRHLAGRLAAMAGTPIPVIQSYFGHENASTTSLYTESIDPQDNVLFGWSAAQHGAGPRQASGAGQWPLVAPVTPTGTPAPGRPEAGPTIIETVGRPVREPEPPLETPRRSPEAPPKRPVQSQPVPPERRIIQVGQAAPVARGSEAIGVEDAVAYLEGVYAQNWGERGERKTVGTGPLVRVFAGTATGLVWWDGPSGALKPELPVMGPAQVAGFEGPFGSVREGLEALWQRWRSGQDRGPTAAAALIGWLRDSLDIAILTDDEVERRGGRWMAHDWPLRLSALRSDESRKNFRLHRDDRVVEWFAGNAWQYRLSRGRPGASGARVSRVIDTRPELPVWYAEPDPLAALPTSERADLTDWLLALTGKPPIDRSPRYQSASRRDLAEIIGLLCEYDDRVDELKELGRSSGKSRDEIATAKEDVAMLAEAAQQRVALATKSRVRDFNLKTLTEARAAETRRTVTREGGQAPESVIDERVEHVQKGRERRREFYMRVIGDLFGKGAAEDEFLRIFALCSRGTPLGEGLYPMLFRFQGGTIVHEPAFAKRFAMDTGAHSECVARRMARELWELRRQHLASVAEGGRGERAISRPDELVETLDAMAAYRVPCPEVLEAELQKRLGTSDRQPVYEEWQRYARQTLPKTREEERSREREETVAEIMAEAQEGHRADIGKEFVLAQEGEYHANARKLVPGPVRLLFALYTR